MELGSYVGLGVMNQYGHTIPENIREFYQNIFLSKKGGKMNKKHAAMAFGGLLGGAIHTIESELVDRELKSKDEAVSIKVPAKLYRVDHIKVNTVAIKQVAGGVDVILINGGAAEKTIGLAEKLITKADDFKYGENVEKRTYFGNCGTPTEITKALNLSEVQRLQDIIDDCKAQQDLILKAIDANDIAVAAFDEE